MAAHLHHPNLVQFIGASTEGELILVTELMTTSLGGLMHRGPLSKAHDKEYDLLFLDFDIFLLHISKLSNQ